jgi:DNA-binding MarR family transcriptional regulator
VDFEQADRLNQAVRSLGLSHRRRAVMQLAPLGLHPGQEVLLLALARMQPVGPARVAGELGIELPTLLSMARKLEASGQITRIPDPADRRATLLGLTPTGELTLDRLRRVWLRLGEELAAPLNDPELATAIDLLERLARRDRG